MKFSLTANANAQHVLQLSISNSTPIYLTKWQTNSVDSQNSFSGFLSQIWPVFPTMVGESFETDGVWTTCICICDSKDWLQTEGKTKLKVKLSTRFLSSSHKWRKLLFPIQSFFENWFSLTKKRKGGFPNKSRKLKLGSDLFKNIYL